MVIIILTWYSVSTWGAPLTSISLMLGVILARVDIVSLKTIYFLYKHFYLENNLTPSRGWSLWRNRFPALPSCSHASPSSAEPFSLWILALGRTDYRTVLNWMSSTVFLKRSSRNICVLKNMIVWYPPIQVLDEQYVSLSLKTILYAIMTATVV